MSKKHVRTYNEIWHERKRTIVSMLLLLVVVMVAIAGFRIIKQNIDLERIRNIFETPEEEHGFSTMYNASRYFFRIYYPEDKWEVEAGDFGFMLNQETGEVARMYPLIYADPVTPAPDDDPAATAVVSFDKIHDPSCRAIFFYREYTEVMLGTAKLNNSSDDVSATDEEVVRTTQPPSETGQADNTDGAPATSAFSVDAGLLDVAAETVYYEHVVRYGASNVGDMSSLTTGRYGYPVKYFTYTYMSADPEAESLATAYKNDVYIIARSTNYIIITFETRCDAAEDNVPPAYDNYRKAFLKILDEFQLSVFDD